MINDIYSELLHEMHLNGTKQSPMNFAVDDLLSLPTPPDCGIPIFGC